MLIPGEIIPIMGIGVAMIAVAGRVIVQPIVAAIMKYSEQRQVPPTDTAQLERRLTSLEERLAANERSMDRVLADRDFYLQLQAGQRPPPGGSPPAP